MDKAEVNDDVATYDIDWGRSARPEGIVSMLHLKKNLEEEIWGHNVWF